MLAVALALIAMSPDAELARWLDQPGVRLVAMVSIPSSCDACRSERTRWKKLAAAHRERGLRVITLVGRDPMLGCADPGWQPDEVLCDAMYDGIATHWNLPEKSSTAFLWGWKGELIVNRGDLSAIEGAVKRQLSASLPRLSIAATSAGRDDLLAIRSALASSNKYELGSALAAKAPVSPACEAGAGLSADATLYVARTGESVRLELHSEAGCSLAAVDGERSNLSGAIGSLFAKIARKLERIEAKQPEASTRDPIGVQLEHKIEKHLGRIDIDGAALVRAVLREAFGVDVGATMQEQLSSGPEVLFDLRDPKALRAGDLIFYVSYGYVPKVVVLYLGNGRIAEAADVRGVVIGPLPLELPWFFQPVVRRPLTYHR